MTPPRPRRASQPVPLTAAASEWPTLTWPGKHREQAAATIQWQAQTGWGNIAGDPPGHPQPDDGSSHLIRGENLHVLHHLAQLGWRGRIKLAYIDPPFDSGVDYRRELFPRGSDKNLGNDKPAMQLAYRDVWQPSDYVQFLYDRLPAIWDLLSDDGSLFFHCDHRRAHHIRCLMDEVFGPEHFRNQIIWVYGSSARGAKAIAGQFPRNHDVILWYGKGPTVDYSPIRMERRVPVAEAKARGYRQDETGNWFKTAPRGDYTDASIARLEGEGRIYRTRTGTVRIKYPLQTDGDCVVEPVPLGDVWTDIPDAMHAPLDEQFTYPTRKPEALLERLIQAATKPGDTVLDCFCGSGSTLVAAQRLQRRWIGCDVNPTATEVASARLIRLDPATSLVGRTPRQENVGHSRAWFWLASERKGKPSAGPGHDADGIDVAMVSGKQTCTITVTGYPAPSAQVKEQGSSGPSGSALVDAIYIDPAFDGRLFRRLIADVPVGQKDRVAGQYTVPLPQRGKVVAIQVVDRFGHVFQRVLGN